jgi:hypothetical protein
MKGDRAVKVLHIQLWGDTDVLQFASVCGMDIR